MRAEKRRKNEGERAKMLESTEIVRERERERELDSKPINTGLFAVSKLYIKYKNVRMNYVFFT